MKEVLKGRASDSMDTLVQQTESPFTAEVLHFPLPAKFRMPQIEAFDGTKDPVDHLNTYKNQMELHEYQDPIRCKSFSITLKGLALTWFNRIPPSSVSSFRELSIAFVSHFIGAKTYRKSSYHLLTIKQSPQESMRSYVQRFHAKSLKVDVPDEKFVVTAFIVGLGVQSKYLMFSISKNPHENMARCSLKQRSTLTAKKPLHPREKALQPIRRRVGLTSSRSEALGDKEIGRDLQGRIGNDPRRGEEASETAWDHLSSSYVNGIHIIGSPP